MRRYGELTGQRVEGCRFRVLRDDDVHGWLGASPDGLIDGLLAQPGAGEPPFLRHGALIRLLKQVTLLWHTSLIPTEVQSGCDGVCCPVACTCCL